VPYLFRVTNSNQDVVFQGTGTTSINYQTLYLISDPLYIRVELDTNPFTASQGPESVSYNLTNTTSTAWFSVSDPENVLNQICLKAVANSTLTVSDQCTANKQTILSYTPTHTSANNSYYTVFGYYKTDAGEIIQDVVILDYRTAQGFRTYGIFGIFLALISIITISVAFADKPMIMVIGIAVSLLALGSQALDIIWLSPIVQGSIIVLSIIVAYLMKEN
jgi:hypothetical protein